MLGHKRLVVLSALMLALSVSHGMAAPLQLRDVLAASDAHYPKIKAALAKQDAAAGKIQEATGAFDLRIDGDAKLRGSGYYDGQYGGAKLVKPLAPLNAEIYSGYRMGRGDFPIYNDELRTRDQGEAHVGVLFSLLRNREIDDRRFKLQDARYDQELADLDTRLTRLTTQLKALHSYGEWVAAGRVLHVYQDLLALAKVRQENLLSRIKAGNAAAIMATENEQNILKRQAMLNEAQRDFIKRTNDLSLFWRDDAGEPLLANAQDLPHDLTWDKAPDKNAITADIAHVLDTRPELRQLDVNISKEKNRLRLGENALLPKVDVALEAAQDMGNGNKNLGQTDTQAMVKMSVPLQREYGKGQVNTAKAQLKQLGHEQRLLRDTIKTELQNIAAELDLTQQNFVLSAREVTLADKMQKAEQELLANGASNLFLVNSREEKAAEARVKNIFSQMYVFKTMGSYYAATVQFDKLGVTP